MINSSETEPFWQIDRFRLRDYPRCPPGARVSGRVLIYRLLQDFCQVYKFIDHRNRHRRNRFYLSISPRKHIDQSCLFRWNVLRNVRAAESRRLASRRTRRFFLSSMYSLIRSYLQFKIRTEIEARRLSPIFSPGSPRISENIGKHASHVDKYRFVNSPQVNGIYKGKVRWI